MNDEPPHKSILWPSIVLSLLVALCVVGLALQVGSWRSELVDRARKDTPVPERRVTRPPPDSKLPAYGEYVYVDEFPEALTKLAPEYPDMARQADVEGMVVVQALIGVDGLVKDTRIATSVPGLDEAAVTAVQQWTFKPARAKGTPVAVWVAVPVKFTLR